MLARVALLLRWLAWSLLLPLAGTILLGASNPLMGLFIVLLAAQRPTDLLAFIYTTGLLPSAITVAIYLLAARRHRILLRVAIACGVAALSAAIWWAVLSQLLRPDQMAHRGPPLLIVAIAALATTLLGFDHRVPVFGKEDAAGRTGPVR